MSKKNRIAPKVIETSDNERAQVLRVIAQESTFNEQDYMYDDTFKPGKISDFKSVHTVQEMIAHLELNPETQFEAIVLEANKKGGYRYAKINSSAKLLEAVKKNSRLKKMREANFREDAFATDNYPTGAGSNAGLVGDDYVPLLGGPFNKQPYLYDYLRAHSYCFHEYHHHPFARAIVHITRDFVLGRGFRIDCDDPEALAMWRAFEEANDLQAMAEYLVKEGSIYGENMVWWLPDSEIYVQYNVQPGQQSPTGKIPRIKMIDPSTVWEIITYPEDINRVLAYVQVFPTQYQIYTGKDAGKPVPTSKFIMQQIPAEDVMHFKYNCASNEKRGRSDLFPVLGYLKWLRDIVNYKLIAEKKQSAWTEDISVEGNQQDVDGLASALKSLGDFEPAGSRFIHTSKIKREYLENKAGNTQSDGMTWGVNMIAAGTQIPVTYFGLSHSAGQTRASAMVGTEPVAKKFEQRQKELSRLLKSIWDKFQAGWGKPGAECKITFPEVISQDSDSKIKRLKFAEDCGYIDRSTAAPMAAKELDIDNYDFEEESAKINASSATHIEPTLTAPLTAPASAPGGNTPPSSSASTQSSDQKPSQVTQDDRHKLKLGMGA